MCTEAFQKVKNRLPRGFFFKFFKIFSLRKINRRKMYFKNTNNHKTQYQKEDIRNYL